MSQNEIFRHVFPTNENELANRFSVLNYFVSGFVEIHNQRQLCQILSFTSFNMCCYVILIACNYMYLYMHVCIIIKIRYNIIKGADDACQKPILQPEKDSSFTYLMCAAVVCLFIMSVIFFTSYVFIKLTIKPHVGVTQPL